MTALRFSRWAQAVKSRPWALAAVVAWWVQRLTGHRLSGKHAHGAWQRACGV